MIMSFYFHMGEVGKKTWIWMNNILFKQRQQRRQIKPVYESVFVQESGCLLPIVLGCVFAEVRRSNRTRKNSANYDVYDCEVAKYPFYLPL